MQRDVVKLIVLLLQWLHILESCTTGSVVKSVPEVDTVVLVNIFWLHAALLPPLLLLWHRDELYISLLPNGEQGLVLALSQLEQLSGVPGLTPLGLSLCAMP